MARTNVSGWLATRVALAAATLVAGGAIVASTSSFAPNVALADEAQFTEVAQDAQTGTATVQVSGTYYLDSAQSVVDSLQSTRAEGSELVQTDALDAKAQVLAAQYAYMGIHSAQSADECVTYLEAAQAGNPADAVAGMTTDWFTEGSALNNTEYGYFGIALFQAQNGDLYLVAVFSNEAGNMGEAGQLVKAQDGAGEQEDGTEVGVPATLTVTVPAEDATDAQSDTQVDPTTVGITYNANGGTGEMVSGIARPNESYILPGVGFDAPEGKQFAHWNTAPDDSGDSYKADEAITLTGNVTLYAIWEDVATTATISFDGNGAQGGSVEAITVDAGGTCQAPANGFTAPEGKQFAHWNTAPDNSGVSYDVDGTIEPTGNMTLYAIWEDVPVTQYQVSFDGNGAQGGSVEAITVDAGGTCQAPANGFTAPEGKQFAHWNTAPDNSGVSYDVDGTIEPTGNMTLYAIWEDVPVTQYQVSFDGNGAQGGSVEAITVDAGGTCQAPANGFTAPEGKQFAHWNTASDNSGVSYDVDGTIEPTGNMTLYAIWEDVPATEVSINFDANGGSGVMESVSAALNDVYTVPSCAFTAPAGKHFRYWAANREGNMPVYQADDTFTVTGETTLYAIWEDDATSQVSISFNANGGTGSMDAVTVDLGSSTTLPKATFTRSGYVFAGWNTKADGTGSSFADGANITPGTNVTLYAKWNQTKYINGIQNNLKVTTTVGTKPTLPTTAGVRWSDGTTSSESVVWTEPDNYQSLYSAIGSFQVTGVVQGHSVKCTVNVVAASDNSGTNNGANGTSANGTTYTDVTQDQANNIAKTGDETDYTPIAIAAGVGVVVVILAVALILKSRKK